MIYDMDLAKISTKAKGVKAMVDLDQKGISHKQHLRNNQEFTPRPNFSGACRALNGQTFSENRPDDFKIMLDSINI